MAPGVSSSYEDQLIKSIRQIQVRLAALEAGQVVLESPLTGVDVFHRLGLCVPLHDYGGTAWRGDALARFFTSNPCIVMPAHGFALAMSCLRDAGEVSGYLGRRLAHSNGLFVGQDELEPLLGWLDRGYSQLEFPRARSVPTFVLPRAYELDPGLALFSERPQDRDLWIEQVYAATSPVDGLSDEIYGFDAAEVFRRLRIHIIDRLELRPGMWCVS
jgi:hypothetical protein